MYVPSVPCNKEAMLWFKGQGTQLTGTRRTEESIERTYSLVCGESRAWNVIIDIRPY